MVETTNWQLPDSLEQQSIRHQPPSQRQLIESLVLLLTEDSYPREMIDAKMSQLAEYVFKTFDRRCENNVYEHAIERAPWLSAESARLQRERQELRQTLQSMCLMARRLQSENRVPFAERFSDFAERLVEHDLAETHFLHRAFPGPDWAEPID
jgi:hypothetical protein